MLGNVLLLLLLVAAAAALLLLVLYTLAARALDRDLAEMAQVFRIPLGARIRYMYIPALKKRLGGGK